MDTLVDNIVHKENVVTKMKSTKYTANAKILNNKIMKRRLNKDPPDNLHLNKIATTLYSETSKYEDNDDARVDKFGYALTRSGNDYLPDPLPSRQITPTPPTSCSRQRPNNRTQRRGQSNSYNNFCTIPIITSAQLNCAINMICIIYNQTNNSYMIKIYATRMDCTTTKTK